MIKSNIVKFVRITLLVCFVLSLFSCATVSKEDIAVLENKPQVSPAIAQTLAKSLKRRVAIARFSNETSYGKGFFADENKDQIGKQAMDLLSAKLASTEKFILFERADIDKINKELKLGNLPGLNIPADYLIIGSVTEFGRKTTSDVGVLSRVKKQEAHAKVSIRLVDTRTGQIVYSEEGSGEAFSEAGTVMGVGSTADYDTSLNDKAISAAISKLVNNIIEKLLDRPWRSYILAHEANSYIISGGKSQNIKMGDIFSVYRKGNTVVNPQTGIALELPSQQVGKIKVTSLSGDSSNEVSICILTEGKLESFSFADLYIQEQ